MTKTIKINEKRLHNIIQNCVKETLKENFEDDYNKASDNYKRHCWGFELKNKDGECSSRKNHYRKGIKLSETKLNNIVRKSVKKVLNENFDDDVNNMVENEKVGRQFIDFIEKYHDGVLMQTIVDYETGNETGEPTSPLPTLIPEFEEAYGIECTTEMKKEIKRQYNQWWYYAQSQLVDNE